jgi:hypothetical protein
MISFLSSFSFDIILRIEILIKYDIITKSLMNVFSISSIFIWIFKNFNVN